AAFTGVFGLKPSFGRVPAWPLSLFGTVSHVGPMTRTVEDAALLLNVISEPDSRDWFALPCDTRDYRDGLNSGVVGVRMAFSPTLGGAKVDLEVAEIVRRAVGIFEELGADVVEMEPDLGDVHAIFRVHWWAGATRVVRSTPPEKRELMDQDLMRIAEGGEAITLADYLGAVESRGALGTALTQFDARYPVLLTPTLPIAAFDAGRLAPLDYGDVGGDWTAWAPFSYPFNLSQQPAASVPCGFTRGGLPPGLQIVGPMHDDRIVLRVARAFESSRPWQSHYARLA
ncbi:MAG: amidase family protein, partial [Casimicrobiaceae bacterium]